MKRNGRFKTYFGDGIWGGGNGWDGESADGKEKVPFTRVRRFAGGWCRFGEEKRNEEFGIDIIVQDACHVYKESCLSGLGLRRAAAAAEDRGRDPQRRVDAQHCGWVEVPRLSETESRT